MCNCYSSGQITAYSLARKWRGKLVREGTTCTKRKMISLRFKNVDSDWSYKCAVREINVFETGKMLPGRSDVSLAATTPHRLQLCTMITKKASKEYGRHSAYMFRAHLCSRRQMPTSSSSLSQSRYLDHFTFCSEIIVFVFRYLPMSRILYFRIVN